MVDVSFTVTVAAVATTVPDVDVVRMLMMMFSDPSVVTSLARVNEKLAVLLLIVTEPELTPLVKSDAVVVPELVQYSTVPSGTLVVFTVNVTADPSLTDVVLGVTE